MSAFVVHATKDGESTRFLFASPVLTHAKARGLLKGGWVVQVTDAEGRVSHPERIDDILRFDRHPAPKF